MATVRLDVEVNSVNEAAIKRVATGLRDAADAQKTWTEAQQRAKQAMEAAHAEALRMNDAMSKGKNKFGEFADTAGKMSTALARSADSFGMNAKALRALDDVMDVAEMGFGNLTKTTVGFNAASLGAAGAGLALGTAIGTWLNTFPAVQKAADDLLRGLKLLATGIDSVEANFKAMRGSGADAALTLEQFAKKYGEMDKAFNARKPIITDKELANLKKAREEAELMKKAQELLGRGAYSRDEARKVVGYFTPPKAGGGGPRRDPFAEQTAREAITQQAYDRSLDEAVKDIQKMQQEVEKIAKFSKEHEGMFSLPLKEASDRAKELAAGLLLARKEADALAAAEEHVDKILKEAQEEYVQHWQDMAGVLDQLGGLMDMLGVSASNAANQIVHGFAAGAAAVAQYASAQNSAQRAQAVLGAARSAAGAGFLGGAATGAAFGSQFGLLGAGVGAAAGGLLGLLGGNREGRQVNDMRDQFIAAAGGLGELGQRAKEAGMTLDELLRADRVSEFEDAVRHLTDSFDLQKQAEEELDAAAKKYGFTIEETGAKYRQQQMDKQVGSLLREYELLTAAEFNHAAILERMGPAFVDYINNARAAGVAIPENLRSVVEELIKQGKLLDANGNAFTSVEQAGLSFTETLTEGLTRVIDAIERLVAALGGVPAAAGRAGGALRGVPSGGGSVREGEYVPSPEPMLAARGFGPAIVPNMGGGLGPLIQTHAGEGVLVVPSRYMHGGASHSWPRAFHALSGVGRDREPGGGGGGGGSGSGGGAVGVIVGGGGGGYVSSGSKFEEQVSSSLSQLAVAVEKSLSRPSVSIQNQPTVNITGAADTQETAVKVSRALDDNAENLRVKIESIAIRAAGRR